MPPHRIEKISPDFEYLTTDLSSLERDKVINGDLDALKRADEFKEVIQKIVEEIEYLYYIENKEPSEIADHFLQKEGKLEYSASERQEIIDYVEIVIKSKFKN